MEEDMNEKAKLEDIIGQGLEAKSYLGIPSLSQVRELFRIRTSMVKAIKANHKNHNKNDLNCEGCGV